MVFHRNSIIWPYSRRNSSSESEERVNSRGKIIATDAYNLRVRFTRLMNQWHWITTYWDIQITGQIMHDIRRQESRSYIPSMKAGIFLCPILSKCPELSIYHCKTCQTLIHEFKWARCFAQLHYTLRVPVERSPEQCAYLHWMIYVWRVLHCLMWDMDKFPLSYLG